MPATAPRGLSHFALATVVVALVGTGGGCVDLALEPAQKPTTLELLPADTLVSVGQQVRLHTRVLDEDGEPIAPPRAWSSPEWSSLPPNAISLSPTGLASPLLSGESQVTVSLAGLSARSRFRVNPDTVTFAVPAVHLIQSVQNAGGSIPLIAGKSALVRAFVTADQTNYFQPEVQAVFYLEDKIFHVANMELANVGVPLEVETGTLELSYNAIIPENVVQPSVEMVIQLIPEPPIVPSPESQLRIPATGRTALSVHTVPPLKLTIVPVVALLHPDNVAQQWSEAIISTADSLQRARALLPLGEVKVQARTPFYTTADLTAGDGWGQLLREITLIHIAAGRPAYYYGAVNTPPGTTWSGVGQIGYPVAVGMTNTETLTHELGHTMTLRHAPCGGAGNPDGQYPYDGGVIGTWGYDITQKRLVSPVLYKDMMSYCQPVWVSDFHFEKALRYRLTSESVDGPVSSDATFTVTPTLPAERSLLLWGTVGAGYMHMDPAFWVEAPSALPSMPGPYRLEGYSVGGALLFALEFSPDEVDHSESQFVFVLPESTIGSGELNRVTLFGPEGSFTLDRASSEPVALVTDRLSGQIKAVLRDYYDGGTTGQMAQHGLATAATQGATIAVSRGLPTRSR